MADKRELRYQRTWYDEPPKPETGAYKFRVEALKGTSDRFPHWPGTNEEFFYECEDGEPEEAPEYTGKLPGGQSFSLKEINELVKQESLDEKNVFLTASMSDDYLCLEVVHINELNDQQQMEEYKDQYTEWAEHKKLNKKRELKDIQEQIASLKRQEERLKAGK